MSGAVVKLTTLSQDGDVLGYTAPVDSPVTGVWDAATKTLTLSGTATKAQYEEALKAVTFSATQGALLVRGIGDLGHRHLEHHEPDAGCRPANVFNPLAPAVGAAGAPSFYVAGRSGDGVVVGDDHRWRFDGIVGCDDEVDDAGPGRR